MPAFRGIRVFNFRGRKVAFGLAGFAQTRAEAKKRVQDFKEDGIPAKITPVLKRISGRFGRPPGGFNLWTPQTNFTAEEKRMFRARGVEMPDTARLLEE